MQSKRLSLVHLAALSVALGAAFSSTAVAETGDVPCDDNEAGDIWTATIPAGANVQVRVDTNDAANAFDPAMDIIPASGPPWVVRTSEYLGGGDDEFPCANPPADGTACPLASGENGAWSGDVAFLVFNLGGCTGPTIGSYEITLTVNAASAPLTLAADNETVEFVFDGDPPTPDPQPSPSPAPTPEPTPTPSPTPQPTPAPAATPDVVEPAASPSSEPEDDGGEPPEVNACRCVTSNDDGESATMAVFGLLALGFALRPRRHDGLAK